MEPSVTEIDLLKKIPLISRHYVKLIDRALAPYQLSSSLYYYIVKLHEFGDLPQERIVQLTGINASNVTRAVQKLIDLHYLTKKENPEDRRGHLLSLTEEGEKMYPIIANCLADVHKEFLAPLSQEEQEIFIKSIQKLEH